MARLKKNNEKNRRVFNPLFDSKPSYAHYFNLQISKKYIRGKKILDVGCWSGQYLSLAQKYTLKSYGIDPGVEAIKIAKKNLPYSTFKQGVAEKLPYDDSFFDVVTIFDVIEHVSRGSEKVVLKEIHRVLKKGGTVILSTPNNNIISMLLDPAYFLIGHRHYSMSFLKQITQESGFTVIATRKVWGLMRLLTVNFEYITKHLFNTKIRYPNWIRKIIRFEEKVGGFAQNYIIVSKV